MSANKIKIVIPRATTNLVTNPSFETGTTSWSNHLSSTISQSTEQSRWGRYSLKVIASGSTKSGAKTDNFTNLSGDDMVVSAWVYAPASQAMKLIIHDVDLASDVATNDFTGTGAWQFVELSYDSFTATNDMYILIGAGDAGSPTFYIDGVMYEEWASNPLTTATTYCDGDQPGCEWTQIEHASTSTRDANTRAGGRIIAIDASSDMKLRHMDGFGMTRYTHLTQPTPLLPGASLQGVKAEPRVLTLLLASMATTEANYLSARQDLIDYLKHHATPNLEPVLIRWNDEKEIQGYYDAGLEGVLNDPYKEQMALRFICYDPYWRQIGENSTDLTTTLLPTVDYIAMRKDGVWSQMDSGVNGRVRAIAYHTQRQSYFIGGDFTTAGGGPTTVNYIAEYNPTTDTWSDLDTGVNGSVYAIEITPSGYVYVGGQFTQAGSSPITANRLACWVPDNVTGGAGNDTWYDVVSCNNDVYALAFSAPRTLYIGGLFTDVSATAVGYVAELTLKNWSVPNDNSIDDMDTGVDNVVYALAADESRVIVGGNFINMGSPSVSVERIAEWDKANATWSTMGAGLNLDVKDIILVRDTQEVYASGIFTGSGLTTTNRVAAWNGSAWVALGTGLNSDVEALAIDNRGFVYVGGKFTDAGGDDQLNYIARWGSGVWVPEGVNIATQASQLIDAINTDRADTLMIGFALQPTLLVPSMATITNAGTAQAWPVFVMDSGPNTGATDPRLAFIHNETTSDELLFHIDISPNESVVIDLTLGRKSVTSEVRGNLIDGVLPASDFALFRLDPGDNLVGFVPFVVAPTTAYIKWRDTYESIDD